MKLTSLLDAGGQWYKGNLHMHTTRSDGKLSPEAAIARYRDAGYDFLALTDHWKQSELKQEKDFLQLPGCEFDTGDMVRSPVFHIVGVGMERPIGLRPSADRPPQALIDAIRGAGGLAFLAHPAWSVTLPEDCYTLEGLSGAEIYNTVSGLPWNARPDSSVYFDIWSTKGKFIRCTAADDCHYYQGEETSSYIMVNAKKLTADAVMSALEQGNFYASQGPEFRQITLDRDTVEVTCENTQTLVFYSNSVWCEDRVFTGGVTKARYRIKPTDTYVRVELIDDRGRRAWCSPFPV